MSVEETNTESEEWQEGVLSDLVCVNPDKGSATSKIPSFRYIDISYISTDGLREPNEIPVVLRADAPSRAQRLVRTGDSLVGTVRPERGSRGLIPEQLDGHVASTGICVLRPKMGSDAEYIYAVVRDEGFTEWCVNHETGTSYPAVSPQDIGRYPLLVPAASERAGISGLLSTLDATIAAAWSTQATIERVIVGECQLAFDGRSQDEEISLVEAVRLVNGGAYTKGADQQGRMVVRIKELNSGPSETTIYNSITVPSEKTVYPGDVLFAWSGSLGVWRWYRDEAILNQHIFKVLPKAHPVWLGWVHVLSALESFQDIAAGKATTMGHITKDHLERARVPKLTAAELEELTARIEPLWDYQLRVGREAHTLTELRKFILPRLLAGELRVRKAGELIEEVL